MRDSFASSLAVLWEVLIGIGGIGLLSSLMMKELPMQQTTDENWGMEKAHKKEGQEEKTMTEIA